jgi:hypothetical protein
MSIYRKMAVIEQGLVVYTKGCPGAIRIFLPIPQDVGGSEAPPDPEHE